MSREVLGDARPALRPRAGVELAVCRGDAELLTDYAGEIDLDVEAFDSALDDGTYAEKVQSQYEESISLGAARPTFLFNEVPYPRTSVCPCRGLSRS